MASKHPKADLYMAEREAGMSGKEIAKKYGVSHQAVYRACARRKVNQFKPYTKEEVVYPYLRKWLNDNKVSRNEFLRRMGIFSGSAGSVMLSNHFRGNKYPTKKTIDKYLDVTGLTYEQFFAEEG